MYEHRERTGNSLNVICEWNYFLVNKDTPLKLTDAQKQILFDYWY